MSKLHRAQTQQGHSRHFFEYIRQVGEAKSKQEEDKIVKQDLVELKKTLSEKNIDKKKLKEYVVRTFYAEMLGHSADFAYIHCVNLSSSPDLHTKRTGYLATWLCVNPEHELMYLIVSNLQKDMKSANFLEVSSALASCAKIIRTELMGSVNGDVTQLLTHSNSLVRKKAVLAMHSFYRKSEGAIGDQKLFRAALCDKDPAVMGASLQLLYEVCLTDPVGQIDLLPSFVSILKQITEHRLPRDFDYHRVPAPWQQIKLLKLMAVLIGADSLPLAEKYKDVLLDTMKRAELGINIGHAIIMECINTITAIHPVPELIEAAANAIAKFLASNNANMKYLGVTALSRIVKIDRKYAQEHQQIVIECLEDPDDTIRRKTLSLLFAMCAEANVETIVSRLMKFMTEANDEFLRGYLVKNICAVSEQYSTNAKWYVDTMNRILEMGADHVPQATIQGVLKLIAEGEGEDEALDAELRTYCVETYFVIMETSDRIHPNALYQVAAWVMGEYGFLTKKVSRAMMIDRLCDMLERVACPITKGWIITSIMKLVAHHGSLPDNVEDLIVKLKDSESVSLQQRCYECLELAKMPALMKVALPLDGCCEEIDVDPYLSFLDDVVQEALNNGAKPYEKKEVRLGGKNLDEGLRTDAYKNTRADVVDEEELNADKFEGDDEVKLIVKDGAKRWGAKNLQEEAAVDKPMEDVQDAPEDAAPTGNNQEEHVDPMADVGPARPTKNEKFMNDIFGGDGVAKKKKKRKGDRAEEALRRAQEAEKATRDMTTENTDVTINPTAPGAAAASSPAATIVSTPTSSGPKAAPENIVKVQTNIQKNPAPDCLRVRFGVMPAAEIRNVRIMLRAPPKCALSGVASNAPKSTVNGNLVEIPMIPANVVAWTEFAIRAEDFPQGGMYGGEVFYCNAKGEECPPIRGAQALQLMDVLRPANAVTGETFGPSFGGMAAGEGRVQIKFNDGLTPDALQKHIGTIANLSIRQVRGKECVAAAQIVPVGHLVLAHITVDGNNANTIIRSNSKEFSDVMARMLFKKD
jgi:AP-4 complex subunit epsilon-1